MLLTRDKFRESVFARDGHKCVICGDPADDAHHIIERRLFTEPHEFGGYFIDNGASVCEPCHMVCEQTLISVEQVREKAGITKKVVPSYIYEDEVIDKWGNYVLANGQRLRGPLFYDESVQKVLRPVLSKFTKYVKYGRTNHLPWSPGIHDDDRVIGNLDRFIGQEIVVTEKMDGENTTVYNDYIHARSIDGRSHPSRDWVKNFAAHWQYNLTDDQRICGENVYAQHSIAYDDLESYFLGFSMWEGNKRLHWDETMENFEILGITPVRTLYRGVYDEDIIKNLWNETMWDRCEGYVMTTVEGFDFRDFGRSVAKFVRKNHVQTAKHHWASQKIIPNGLTPAE